MALALHGVGINHCILNKFKFHIFLFNPLSCPLSALVLVHPFDRILRLVSHSSLNLFSNTRMYISNSCAQDLKIARVTSHHVFTLILYLMWYTDITVN